MYIFCINIKPPLSYVHADVGYSMRNVLQLEKHNVGLIKLKLTG